MSRPLRIEYPGAFYHVMNRAIRSHAAFLTDNDYKGYLALLEDAWRGWDMRAISCCLMETHYHLALQIPHGNLQPVMRRIDQEIINKTTINRKEVMNDNFLVLTEQEEYVSPHTGDVEVDTDAYKYRWKTDGGNVYYTNREDENPNLFLQRTDYKLTPIRKRKNE